jgi:hypothetical protein
MNHTLFEKHYQEQLKLLPDISQRALASVDWVVALLDIGKSYALQLDELEDLQVETMMLLTGVTTPDEYEDTLTEMLPLSKTELYKLLDEVNDRILSPIHDFIVSGGVPATTPVAPVTTPVQSPAPMRIDPTDHRGETLVTPETLSTPTAKTHADIMEHKLDDIFHEEVETMEHI